MFNLYQNRRQIDTFLFFFQKTEVSQGYNLHEMSNPILLEKWEQYFTMLLKFLTRHIKRSYIPETVIKSKI